MAKAKNDFLKENPDGSVNITFSRPLDVNGASVAWVRMREPLVSDQQAVSEMKGTDASREVSMFANLCELAPDDICRLPLRDYKRLQTAFLGFID